MAASLEVGKFFRAIIHELEGSVTQKHLKALGEYAVKLIVTRTRLGYGVDRMGASRKRLKPLSDSYVSYRMDNRAQLSNLTTPGRSNLTFSGQMLESMRVTKSQFGVVKVGPYGRRKDGQRNSTILIENEKRGRLFNYLSDLELKKVARFYEHGLDSRLKKLTK